MRQKLLGHTLSERRVNNKLIKIRAQKNIIEIERKLLEGDEPKEDPVEAQIK